MTWILIAIAGWLAVGVVVGLLAWGLSRSAAIGDRHEAEQQEFARAFGAEAAAVDRRVGPKDRRSSARPWADGSLGRRAEDVLREDLAEAERALRDAEKRLSEIEARESA